MQRSVLFTTLLAMIISCIQYPVLNPENQSLGEMTITIDPGHGNTSAYDHFRVGPAGEREEWINLRVAHELQRLLEKAGAKVVMTRSSDTDVNLGGRAAIAIQAASDLFISIHHNGSSDPDMDYPLVYFWGAASTNPASVDFALELISALHGGLVFEQNDLHGVFSDHLIYPAGTAVLRNSYPYMPGIIGESGFFTNPEGEKRLRSKRINKREAGLYFKAVLAYNARGLPSAIPIQSSDSVIVLDGHTMLSFKLSDGLGGHAFIDSTIHVLVEDKVVAAEWDPAAGQLSLIPPINDHLSVSIKVFGRTRAGNALHPKRWDFLTVKGDEYYRLDNWRTAYYQADSVHQSLTAALSADPQDTLEVLRSLEEAVELYRLSLDLQLVHLNALEAEERILELLITRNRIEPADDISQEIDEQRRRLEQYYPYVSRD